MKKIGLVIQGPLMSIGKDGERAHIPKVVMGEEGFVHYDCRENIQKLITDFGNLFDVVVVATWDNEVKPGDGWEGVTLVSMPDPGEIQRATYNNRSRNKFRQFIGIRHGLVELQKIQPVDYVVRVRTDQYLDVPKLLESFFASIEEGRKDSEVIGVPFTRPADFFTHDIYFIARFDTLKRFCDAILAFDLFEFISCVHRDILLKYAYGQYRDQLKVPISAYFPYWPPCGASTKTKKIFNFMFENVFAPLDPAIFSSVIWRGTKLSQPYVDVQYKDKRVTHVRKNLVSIPALISTNWKRYFAFLGEIENRKPAFTDTLVVAAGSFGWKIWYALREIASRTKITNIIYKLLR